MTSFSGQGYEDWQRVTAATTGPLAVGPLTFSSGAAILGPFPVGAYPTIRFNFMAPGSSAVYEINMSFASDADGDLPTEGYNWYSSRGLAVVDAFPVAGPYLTVDVGIESGGASGTETLAVIGTLGSVIDAKTATNKVLFNLENLILGPSTSQSEELPALVTTGAAILAASSSAADWQVILAGQSSGSVFSAVQIAQAASNIPASQGNQMVALPPWPTSLFLLNGDASDQSFDVSLILL